MSKPEDNMMGERDGDELDAKFGVHRLLDILTQEVSLVRRAANQRTWLVQKGNDMETNEQTMEKGGHLPHSVPPVKTKTEDGDKGDKGEDKDKAKAKGMMLPKAVKAAVLGMLLGAKNKIKACEEHVKAATEDEESKAIPPQVANDFKTVVSVLRGIGSKYASSKTKDADGTDAKLDDVDLEKQVAISSAVKAKVLQVLGEAYSKLDALVKEIEAAEESADASAPLPESIASTLEATAKLLEGALAAYAPKSKAEDEEEDEEKGKEKGKGKAGDEEEDEEKRKQQTKALSANKALGEAATILDGVVAKVSPGQALDEDSYQKLDRLRAMLASAAKAKPSEDEENQDKGAPVAKAGAKMSAKRRKRFEEAIKSLISLFKEVIPSADIGKMPHLVTKSDDEPDKETEELRTKLEKAEADLVETKKELDGLKSKPQGSNMEHVDEIQKAGDKKKADDVTWPMDLNSEDDD